MSERTGLDPLETAVVLAAPPSNRPHAKSARIILDVEQDHGYGPGRAYEALTALANDWLLWRPPIDGHGNFGSPDHPPAEARYTEARLSPVGDLAAAAERGDGPAIPLGLIEGTHHRGGSRPPYDPTRVISALRLVLEGETDVDEVVGGPAFASGCEVEMHDGVVALSARLTVVDDRTVEITNLPPGWGGSGICQQVFLRRDLLALRDVSDVSRGHHQRVMVTFRDRPDLDELREVWGVRVIDRAQVPPDVAGDLRRWVETFADERTPAVLDALA